jgi:hypothetical protein
LADRELVGQGAGPVGDADAVGADAAAVARDDTAGDAGEADDAGEDAAVDADEAPVVEAPVAGDEAEDDAPVEHPATPIPTTAAAATAASRPADRVEPNIADLFPAAQAPQQLSVT